MMRGSTCPSVRWLFDNNQLVDEITRATPKGVTIQVYRPSGRPQYVTPPPETARSLPARL
jgi:hypothetical protein